MHDRNLLAPWVKRFLLEYLVAERNLARNTQFPRLPTQPQSRIGELLSHWWRPDSA